MSHRESSIAEVICVGDRCAPLNHVDTHVPITIPRDHDGNQPGLRTWKCLARLNQTVEPAMHAPTLGKCTIEAKHFEETRQASKRMQNSDGDHFILAEAAVQSF